MASSLVAQASKIFFGATVAGAGLSLGRDLYDSAKRHFWVLILLAILLTPMLLGFIGGLAASRRQISSTIAGVTVIGLGICAAFITQGGVVNILFAVIDIPFFETSIFAQDIVVPLQDYLTMLFGLERSPFVRVEGGEFDKLALNAFTLSWLAPCGIGLLIGAPKARREMERDVVAKRNQEFLNRVGLRETGESDVTHIDPYGILLRLIEAGPDRFTFMVVGQRGRRAYLELNEKGEFTRYVPAQATEARATCGTEHQETDLEAGEVAPGLGARSFGTSVLANGIETSTTKDSVKNHPTLEEHRGSEYANTAQAKKVNWIRTLFSSTLSLVSVCFFMLAITIPLGPAVAGDYWMAITILTMLALPAMFAYWLSERIRT